MLLPFGAENYDDNLGNFAISKVFTFGVLLYFVRDFVSNSLTFERSWDY